MRVGVIVQDVEGFVLASMCTTVSYITDLTLVEDVAIWKAVFFSFNNLGLQRVFLEGEALEIVNTLHQDE